MRPWWLPVVVVLAACDPAEDDNRWHSDASCTVRDTAGRRCHDYDLTRPEQRATLRDTCQGIGSTFDDDDPCADDDLVGICELHQGLLIGTHVYDGYSDVAGFITACEQMGGTWYAD